MLHVSVLKPSEGNEIYDLNHKYVCIEMFRNLQDLTNFYKLFSNRRIATRCGLDGPGNEFRWGRDFSHPSRHVRGPTQPRIQWVESFPGIKRPGRGVDHPLPSSAEVKGKVEL